MRKRKEEIKQLLEAELPAGVQLMPLSALARFLGKDRRTAAYYARGLHRQQVGRQTCYYVDELAELMARKELDAKEGS